MKQFFLSSVAMLLFATTSFAQAQVEVFNTTASCDFDVTVTSYDCTTAISVYGPTKITAGNSFLFTETSTNVTDFEINVVGNGNSTTFMSNTHVTPSCLILPFTVGATGTPCGGAGNVVILPRPGTAFPSSEVLIDWN